MVRLWEFIKSIFAGVAISIGGMIYLSCDNKYVGALLFSTGLISVVMLGFNLYTGRIGYVLKNDKIFLLDTVLSIFGNLVGCIICGLLKSNIGNVAAICSAKLSKPLINVFVDAVFCGILIFLCVDIYKKHKNVIGIIFCIPTFILCGFEHSVADMFYFVNAGIFSFTAVLFIIIVILGNAVGGLFIPFLSLIESKIKKA